MITIAVLGTFDTKGAEHAYVAEYIRSMGHQTLMIDVGTGDKPTIAADLNREDVLGSADDGTSQSEGVTNDRGQAIARMTKAIPPFLRQLCDQGKIQGVIALGGSGGTAIGTAAMRALPIGLPKVMVSTMSGGNVSQYVGVSDIVMFPSIVDVSGLNRISRGVFARAAAAVAAMAEANSKLGEAKNERPLIAASMFGNTTRCVEHARQLLEKQGYEVIVFHATGVGGKTMEALIDSGMVAGVFDVTTTEWADELVGGVMPGGPHRLESAAKNGVPAIVTPGCLDMVNFGEPASVPGQFKNRTFYQHNPQVTLMRTTPQECRQLGKLIAEKLNASRGEVRFLFPLKAISVISAKCQPFHDPDADNALLESLRESLAPNVRFETVDCEINDPVFAERCVSELLNAMHVTKGVSQ